VEGVEGGAGAERIDAEREDALEDLRGHELDGGVVLEERNGDVARLGQGGAAIAVVGEAEVESAEDFVFAAVAVDGEGAALGPVGGGSLGESGIKLAGCNRDGFRQRFAWHDSLQRVERRIDPPVASSRREGGRPGARDQQKKEKAARGGLFSFFTL
jgi:hypothetical protein